MLIILKNSFDILHNVLFLDQENYFIILKHCETTFEEINEVDVGLKLFLKKY